MTQLITRTTTPAAPRTPGTSPTPRTMRPTPMIVGPLFHRWPVISGLPVASPNGSRGHVADEENGEERKQTEPRIRKNAPEQDRSSDGQRPGRELHARPFRH